MSRFIVLGMQGGELTPLASSDDLRELLSAILRGNSVRNETAKTIQKHLGVSEEVFMEVSELTGGIMNNKVVHRSREEKLEAIGQLITDARNSDDPDRDERLIAAAFAYGRAAQYFSENPERDDSEDDHQESRRTRRGPTDTGKRNLAKLLAHMVERDSSDSSDGSDGDGK